MALPSFSSTVVARAAAALYGLQLGNGTMTWVLNEASNTTGGVDALINAVYNRDYGTTTNAKVAEMVVANLGITGAGVTDARTYIEGVLNANASSKGAAIASAAALFSGLTSHAVYGAAATAFNDRIASAVAYAQQGGTSDRAFSAGSLISLTTGQDFLSGTAGNDTIVARIFDNANTLQSGDWVDGGAGTDKLEADLASSAAFAITPETAGVEHFVVRGQSRNANDTSDNNLGGEGRVIVDAERMGGVTRFDSNGSRADVIIEDVRTSLRTKDITIGMIGTDQGNVDYAVYFDRLRADSASVAQLTIELMDTRAASAGLDPLKDSPYNGFSFFVNGSRVTLKDDTPQSTDTATFNGAQTYTHLLAAIRAMLTKAGLASQITADFGPDFTAIDTRSGISSTGRTIVLSGSTAGGVTLGVGNFIADDGVPADSGLHTVQSTAVVSSTDLITSTVILDDVGRGSNGGDLVIGAKSVGETSTSVGIGRFEITVENNSALGIISSTNNALKEVDVGNGTVKGTLRVNGFDNSVSIVPGGIAGNDNGNNNNLPGATAQHNAYAFNDVRKIDMSDMTGAVSYDAQITASSFAKYIQLTDTDPQPSTDNDSTDGKTTRQVADFDYSGGAGNDTVAVVIDENVIASDSRVQVGREDFSFLLDGKAGDDSITVVIGRVDRDTNAAAVYGSQGTGELTPVVTVASDGESDDEAYLPGGLANWYEHQNRLKNVTINGGDGADTIRKPGSGDVTYNLGAGNDTLYTDNTGTLNTANTVITNSGRAMWVFNTDDQLTPAAAGVRNVDDLISTLNTSWYLYRASLTVTYRGTSTLGADTSAPADALESASVPIGFSSTTYKSSDLHINQAIKAAINNDPVLSKLLVAEDGPGYSLVVKSLIDGAQADNNISVNFTLPNSNQLTTTEVSKVAAAWEQDFTFGSAQQTALRALITTPSASGLIAFLDGTGVGALVATGNGIVELESGAAGDGQGYVAVLGNDAGGVPLTGAVSTATTTDNVITGGAGNDVIVLSTTEGASALESSNDRIKFADDFGRDTIVHFDTAGNGIDRLDVTSIGGYSTDRAGVSIYTFDGVADNAAALGDLVNGAINVQTYSTAGMTALTTAIIAGRYAGNATMSTDYFGTALTSETFVYVAVDPHNVGHVYKVVDTLTATATVTKMGEIDLAEVPWSTLVFGNFFGAAP